MQRTPSDFRVMLHNGKQITEDWIEPTFTLRLFNTTQITKWFIYIYIYTGVRNHHFHSELKIQAIKHKYSVLPVPSEGFLCQLDLCDL